MRVTAHRTAALALLAVPLIAGLAAAPAAAAGTLDAVRARGAVLCGVSSGVAGFSLPDAKGDWTGLDVDLCRGIAAAVFDDPSKVRFVKTTAKERFTALQSGEADLLARNTTWSLSRDTTFGFNFVGINYYDGQGFMVRKSLGVTAAKELSGASICVQQGTTTELNLADYFRTNKLAYQSVVFESIDDVTQAYDAGRCDAITNDASGLYTNRLKLKAPEEHVVLKEVISKEPLGPLVRHGDDQWFDVVKWVHFAMINGEEFGITRANAAEMAGSPNPEIKRLLGTEGKFGDGLGLPNDWALRVLRHVGNYGEVFERNVGAGSRLAIARGLNELWSKGGLQYAPPVR